MLLYTMHIQASRTRRPHLGAQKAGPSKLSGRTSVAECHHACALALCGGAGIEPLRAVQQPARRAGKAKAGTQSSAHSAQAVSEHHSRCTPGLGQASAGNFCLHHWSPHNVWRAAPTYGCTRFLSADAVFNFFIQPTAVVCAACRSRSIFSQRHAVCRCHPWAGLRACGQPGPGAGLENAGTGTAQLRRTTILRRRTPP